MELIINFQDGKILLKLNREIFTQEAILETSYKFTHSCNIHIDSELLYFKVFFSAQNDNINLKDQVDRFYNELIDQQIRYNLSISNKEIKELIIRKAFFPFQNDDEK
jgi:His-Xaa-Ser system protein HxsD